MILGGKKNEIVFLYNLYLLRKRSGYSQKWVEKILNLIFQDMEYKQLDIRIRDQLRLRKSK